MGVENSLILMVAFFCNHIGEPLKNSCLNNDLHLKLQLTVVKALFWAEEALLEDAKLFVCLLIY